MSRVAIFLTERAPRSKGFLESFENGERPYKHLLTEIFFDCIDLILWYRLLHPTNDFKTAVKRRKTPNESAIAIVGNTKRHLFWQPRNGMRMTHTKLLFFRLYWWNGIFLLTGECIYTNEMMVQTVFQQYLHEILPFIGSVNLLMNLCGTIPQVLCQSNCSFCIICPLDVGSIEDLYHHLIKKRCRLKEILVE